MPAHVTHQFPSGGSLDLTVYPPVMAVRTAIRLQDTLLLVDVSHGERGPAAPGAVMSREST